MQRTRMPTVRKATLTHIVSPETKEIIEYQAIVVYFEKPYSFTGQHVLEIHVHGNRIILTEVFKAIEKCGARAAKAGEFTRRAFENGKIDLTQVEGLADLLNAETEQQRKQATRQVGGAMTKVYEKWKTHIILCLAHMEAIIDFAEDEHDVGETEILKDILPKITLLRKDMQHALHDERRGEILRNGIQVVIAGPPNAGKSTLMNQLAQRDVSIVSPVAGTTRDVVEVSLNLAGWPVCVADTAGLRNENDSIDTIEHEGMRRARVRLSEADIKLIVLDSTDLLTGTAHSSQKDDSFVNGNIFVVLNKADELLHEHNYKHENMLSTLETHLERLNERFNRPDSPESDDAENILIQRLREAVQSHFGVKPMNIVLASCKHEAGIVQLLQRLTQLVKDFFQRSPSETFTATTEHADESSCDESQILITRQRHRKHLQDCVSFLMETEKLKSNDLVLSAEYLRQATRCLGMIAGRVHVEQLLDVIFRDFCIGK